MSLEGIGANARGILLGLRKDHQMVKPRKGKSRITREAFTASFKALVDEHDLGPFMKLADRVKDGERDLVAVLLPRDLSLLHAFRRHLIARCNPHLIGFDNDLMRVLITLSWRKATWLFSAVKGIYRFSPVSASKRSGALGLRRRGLAGAPMATW
jgi:hypothetical protein